MPGRSNAYKSALKQDVVYWGAPTNDGYGGSSYAAPVEIKARWEQRSESFTDPTGEEKQSTAVVYVDRVVALGGLLYLGTLADLSSAEESDPLALEDAHEIKMVRFIPNHDATQHFREALL